MVGLHFCPETKLLCGKMRCSQQTYDVKDGYDTNNHDVIVTICSAHTAHGFEYGNYGKGHQIRLYNLKNSALVRRAIARYLFKCGFEELELHTFFLEAGLLTDMYLRDHEWYLRPRHGNLWNAEKVLKL
ncbi:hypothetical protein H0W80_03530 [Candidatus Saccharibacteria bacterium]|nr:hypothetical protein [Candidatus Saccharibacteria bacterium]